MTPPQRIMMTADAVGGVWVFATTLARELCRRGAEVTIVTLGPPPSESEIWALNDIEGLEFEITDLALEWMEPEGLDLPRAQFRLASLERRIRPDIVHLNAYREAGMNWQAPVVLTAHSCVRSWWLACRGTEPNEPRWKAYVDNVGAGLAAAALWVAPTAAFRDTMQALYAPLAEGAVVLNGIEPLSPAEKEPFILAAGRVWDEAKNIGLLAAIAAELPWPLRIAGVSQFPGIAEIGTPTTTAERIGALERGRLLAEMQRAAIFVASPFYEPFGLTILEAAASGCALVLSEIPTLRELWDGAALFANPGDQASFKGALTRVCDNADLRLELQTKARQRAAHYSLQAMADGYAALYDELLQARGPADKERLLAGARP